MTDNLIREFYSGVPTCTIRTDTYAHSFAHIRKLVAAARADFPALRDEDIAVKVYAGQRQKAKWVSNLPRRRNLCRTPTPVSLASKTRSTDVSRNTLSANLNFEGEMMTDTQWFPDISNEEWDRQEKNVRRIQRKVAERTGRSYDWIARQRIPETGEWTGVGFIVDRKCLFLPNDDVMHDPEDQAFIDRLATEVMGYAPDSREDYEYRRQEAREMVKTLRAEITKLERQRQHWLDVEADMLGKIALL